MPAGRGPAPGGSARNGHRPKLLKILHDPTIGIIAVEHRDRLIRFGFEYVEAALAAQGRKLIVVEEWESRADEERFMEQTLVPAFKEATVPQPSRVEWFNAVMNVRR